MNIENGWSFHSADFSVPAHRNPLNHGSVTLVRSIKDIAQWHKISDEIRESDNCPALYVTGSGETLESAITDANLSASLALPIQSVEGK